VSLAPLLGCPFGACFALGSDGRLRRSAPASTAPAADVEADARSNKALVADPGAQALDASAIAALKASGADVVAALAQSSATFEQKTAFSQAKYLSKKRRKHCTQVAALRPTAARVAAVLFAKSPERVAFLRPDALALALAFADAGAGGRTLVMDGSGGLATAAALERASGLGDATSAAAGVPPVEGSPAVVVVHAQRASPPLDCVRFFNFGPEALALLWRAPLEDLEAAAGTAADSDAPAPAPEAADAPMPDAAPEGAAGGDAAPAGEADGAQKRRQAPSGSSGRVQVAGPAQLSAWAGAGGFTSLLCAAPAFEPLALLQRLLPLLAGGAPFALFANCLQPLAEAAEALRAQRVAVCVEVHEPFQREYQVLPQRTHPHMAMHATAGYVLVGLRALPVTSAKRQRT
jgi:tRNA (adenine-N(1)-)-methyltransferase non-catalytic subunit